MKRLLLTVLAAFAFLVAFPQIKQLTVEQKAALWDGFCLQCYKSVETNWMLGFGSANVLDTYLSPYDYKGNNFRFQWETNRMVSTFGIKNVKFQTLADVDISFLENPGKNVDEYTGGLRFAMGWAKQIHYFPINGNVLELFCGPMLSGYLGGIYNERNGNNPAQAKLDLMIDFTAQAVYKFNLWKMPFKITCQLIWPVAGIAFSPNFGQSYYEAFMLDNDDHNVVFAHPGNMPSMRHRFLIDIPLTKSSKTLLRLAYLGNFMQSNFNHLRYHSYTNTFMIGLTKSILR